MSTKSPDPIDILVGTRVRARRMARGVSQEMLAAGLDLTFQQIQKYEKGINRIGASRLCSIAKILDVPVGFFFESASAGDGRDSAAMLPSSFMDRFMASREGVMIARGFDAIAEPGLRGAIARFVRDAGQSGDAMAGMVRADRSQARGLAEMIRDYGVDCPLVQQAIATLLVKPEAE